MNDVLEEGKDLSNFLWEMIKHTKDILMYKVSKRNEIYSEEEINKIAKIAEKASKEELINIIYKLSELDSKMRLSSQKTIVFETEIIKLCVKQDIFGLEDRVEKLEEVVYLGKTKVNTSQDSQAKTEQKVKPETQVSKAFVSVADNKKEAEKQKETKMQPTMKIHDAKSAEGTSITNWQSVLDDLKKQGKVILYANLVNTEAIEVNDMTVVIKFYNGLNQFRKKILNQAENINLLTKEISIMCGKTMQLKFEDASGIKQDNMEKSREIQIKKEKKTEKNDEDDILSSLDIPINIVDE